MENSTAKIKNQKKQQHKDRRVCQWGSVRIRCLNWVTLTFTTQQVSDATQRPGVLLQWWFSYSGGVCRTRTVSGMLLEQSTTSMCINTLKHRLELQSPQNKRRSGKDLKTKTIWKQFIPQTVMNHYGPLLFPGVCWLRWSAQVSSLWYIMNHVLMFTGFSLILRLMTTQWDIGYYMLEVGGDWQMTKEFWL